MQYSPKYMTDKERLLLWQNMSKRYKLVAQTMYYTGLRLGETLRLNLADFNPSENNFILRHQKNKMQNELIIIPEPLKKLLYSYISYYEEEIKENSGWIFFSTKTGKPLTIGGYSYELTKARKKAGLDQNTVYKISKDGRKYHRITAHTHKNESIRVIYNATKDFRSAQAQGHHKNPLMTHRYLNNPLMDIKLKEENAKIWEKK